MEPPADLSIHRPINVFVWQATQATTVPQVSPASRFTHELLDCTHVYQLSTRAQVNPVGMERLVDLSMVYPISASVPRDTLVPIVRQVSSRYSPRMNSLIGGISVRIGSLLKSAVSQRRHLPGSR